MTREAREAREASLAKRTAHAMRAAAIRLARERAGQDADPAQAYGCVDWFRYEVSERPQEEDTGPPPAAARRGVEQGGEASTH